MAWTNEMIEGLKKMWKKGLTTNEIAKELGVSKNSIVGKVHRLNLTSRPSPIKKKEEDEFATTASTVEPVVEKEAETVVKDEVKTPKINKITVNPIEVKAHKNTCLKLSELDSHTCRWPIGDPKDDNFCFCGKKVRAGQTYCDEHAAIAYVKPNKK